MDTNIPEDKDDPTTAADGVTEPVTVFGSCKIGSGCGPEDLEDCRERAWGLIQSGKWMLSKSTTEDLLHDLDTAAAAGGFMSDRSRAEIVKRAAIWIRAASDHSSPKETDERTAQVEDGQAEEEPRMGDR